MRITEVKLTKKQRVELEYIEHFDSRPFMQKRSRIILDKADGMPSKKIAERLSCSEHKVNRWVRRYLEQGIDGLRNKPGQGAKPIMDSSDEEAVRHAIEKDRLSVMKAKERWQQATGKEACRDTQLYDYKKEKLQELEQQYREGLIDLYFGDGSFTCTEGYVPYGWQFPGESITIPSDRGARLNIWGMIDYNSRYHGFCSTESMTSERIADFLDKFSLTIRKDTFIVLDNAKVHRSKYMKEMRKIWEKRGLFLFFLPPYSPHLNIAETLWRMLKGQWIQPADYVSTDNLFYAVNRGLAGLGKSHFINFSKRA